ncbi:MAG: GGDEF domain-containing protein, partial [Nitrosomonadales bacterium]|nr:GGDEF domain-containing protein [Nitrosomonadales bacterium]
MHNVIDSKRKVIFLLWILLCIGFFVTSIASYYVSKNAIRDAIITSELPLTADNIYSEIQKDLIRPIFISSMMASDTFVRD